MSVWWNLKLLTWKIFEKEWSCEGRQRNYFKMFVIQKIWGINKLRFFIYVSNIHHQICLILLKLFYFYNRCINFNSWVFKNGVIDRYMHYIIQKFKTNVAAVTCTCLKYCPYGVKLYPISQSISHIISAQVCIYSLVDLNIDHCVEFTFLEGKLDGFLVIRV